MGKYFFDQFSYLHFAVGIVLYFWLDLKTSIIIHTIYELIDNTPFFANIVNKYITLWPGKKPYSDTLTNSIGDTFFFIIGWISAYLVDLVGNKYKLYPIHRKNF